MLMNTVSIPKSLMKMGDLVLIPKSEYRALLKRQKVIPVVKLTPSEKKAIKAARKEIARGEYITLEELERELGIVYQKTR